MRLTQVGTRRGSEGLDELLGDMVQSNNSIKDSKQKDQEMKVQIEANKQQNGSAFVVCATCLKQNVVEVEAVIDIDEENEPMSTAKKKRHAISVGQIGGMGVSFRHFQKPWRMQTRPDGA